jgi:type III restriction enzyme
MLVLETKGQVNQQVKEKRRALEEWVKAVNETGEFGEWCSDTSYNVADVDGIVAKWFCAENPGIKGVSPR